MSAHWEIRQGSVLDRLRELEDESVHCVITSPPYYGLRDYDTGSEWEGGDPSCDHVKGEMRRGSGLASSPAPTRGGAKKIAETPDILYAHTCGKCGATRTDEQIGLEDTPEEYIDRLLEVFAEVHRVLRADGTLWLNMGDSYARGAGPRDSNFGRAAKGLSPPDARDTRRQKGWAKEKDLLGMPWTLALALRNAGWYLRSDVIWAKPNPMPESIRDRPTSSHEYVFLLSKSARYFYDDEAIREPDKGTDHARSVHHEESLEPSGGLMSPHKGIRTGDGRNGRGRNKRDVWEVATVPYPDAHFATFPPRLIEPMILAGASPQTCTVCAAPYERLVEVEYENPGNRSTNGPRSEERKHLEHGTAGFAQRLERRSRTLGWQPTCAHTQGGGRSIVLDPFAGSGTTLHVAVQLGRDAIGIELSAEYVRLAERRLAGANPPLWVAEGER